MSLCSFPTLLGLLAIPTPPGPWTALSAYALDDQVINGGNVYVCVVAGISAAAGGPVGVGSGIVDDTVTWDYVGPFTPPGIPAIPSLTLTIPHCIPDEF